MDELRTLRDVYYTLDKLQDQLDDTYNIDNENLDVLYKFIVDFKKDLAFDIRVLRAVKTIEEIN